MLEETKMVGGGNARSGMGLTVKGDVGVALAKLNYGIVSNIEIPLDPFSSLRLILAPLFSMYIGRCHQATPSLYIHASSPPLVSSLVNNPPVNQPPNNPIVSFLSNILAQPPAKQDP